MTELKKSVAFWCLTLVLALALGGRAASPLATQGGAAVRATSESARTPVNVLGPGDQITIHAVDVPDLSDKPQRIDQTGDLRLPVVGRIHAAGMTAEQLEAELRDRLSAFLNNPDVTVTTAELRSQTVTVVGAVGQPGVRLLEGNKTLIEVLSIAGGASADAGPIVRVTRRADQGRIPLSDAKEIDGGLSVVDIPLKPLLDANAPDKNIDIYPNDLVAVPRAEVVYVVGEVGRVGTVPVTRGNSVSVVEAISASGGVLRTGAGGSARIVRATAGNGPRMEVPVDVNKIMHGRSADVPMYAGDILVVPDSTGKRATTRALEAAVQLGLLVGSYGILH